MKPEQRIGALERVTRRLVSKLFGDDDGRAALTMTLTRDSDGARIDCTWSAGEWCGSIQLRKPPTVELSAKELGGIITWLENVDRGE